jgi:hypothetical protein
MRSDNMISGLVLPRPPQTLQACGFAFALPPEPLHVPQTTFFVFENLVVLPLYSSSSVTSYCCSTLRPFLGTCLPPGPPGMPPIPPMPGIPPKFMPPPNICAKMSSMSGSPPMPPPPLLGSNAAIPWVSYRCRLSSS